MSTWLAPTSHDRRSRREARGRLSRQQARCHLRPYVGKRTLDLVLATSLLIVLAPVILVVFVAVRVTSPGGAVFRQVRVGAMGQQFVLLKFRTMTQGCSSASHQDYVQKMMAGEMPQPEDGVYKLSGDPRVTRLGRILRRTSIDELPQLFNVIRGQMSLVGPRPVLPWEVELFPPSSTGRFQVLPGLTGLWQVSGRNRLTMLEGLQLDVDYVSRCALLTDLQIILCTPWCLLRGGAR